MSSYYEKLQAMKNMEAKGRPAITKRKGHKMFEKEGSKIVPSQMAMRNTKTHDDNGSAASLKSPLYSLGFIVGERLGTGSYAEVRRAFYKQEGIDVAIKDVDKRKAEPEFLARFLNREVEVIKRLKHPNLINFLKLVETTNHVYMIMDIAENGSVLDVIKENGYVDELTAGIWFHQIIDGLEYIHKLGVAHRDMKSENLLLDKKNHIRITDFGFAKTNVQSSDLSKTFCGSYAYAPVEILYAIPYYPFAADIWSTAVILFMCLYGKLPFSDKNYQALLAEVVQKCKFPEDPPYENDVKDMIRDRLLVPQKRRIGIKEIKLEAWYAKIAFQIGKESGSDKTSLESMLTDEEIVHKSNS